jgi:hypothetical protein
LGASILKFSETITACWRENKEEEMNEKNKKTKVRQDGYTDLQKCQI